MPDKMIRLRIITPAKTKIDEDFQMVVMRCTTGDMGILYGHEPYSAVLGYGILRMVKGGIDERRIAVYGGFAEIRNNVLTVLTGDAEWPDEIDQARAQADRDAVQERLRDKTDDMELKHDEALLRRALVQIEITSEALTAKDE